MNSSAYFQPGASSDRKRIKDMMDVRNDRLDDLCLANRKTSMMGIDEKIKLASAERNKSSMA